MSLRVVLYTAIVSSTALSCVSSSKYKELEDEKNKEVAARLKMEEQLKKIQGNLTQTQSDFASQTSQLKDQLNKTEAEKAAEQQKEKALREELDKRKAELESRDNQLQSLTEKLKAFTDAGKLKVRIVDGRLVLDLPSDVLFSSGSAKISKQGQQTLHELGTSLAQIEDQRFQIEGHTDNARIRTAAFPSNWDLASSRALTVLKIFVAAGLDSTRISAASYGEMHPVASNDNADGRSLNRRIEVVVVPDLSIIAPPTPTATPASSAE